jgi:DNA repair exonuclease SbcCD ATPase subunit
MFLYANGAESMKIDLKMMKLKNFLSVGNNGITMDFRKGLYRVNGENHDTGTRNGVGKSAVVCDGLIFALFGKPMRKINLPDLPNTINGRKGLETEIHFTINGNDYIVERGIKPNYLRLTINGKIQDEDSAKRFTQKQIDAIIDSDYNTFTHMLVISNTYSKPFLDLTSAEKRVILEDILGVSIFGKMGELAKGKQTENKSDFAIAKKEYDITFASYEELKNTIRKLVEKSQVFEEQKKKDIAIIEGEITAVEEEISVCKSHLENDSDYAAKVDALKKHKARLDTKLQEVKVSVETKKGQILKNNQVLKQLVDSPVCSVCGTSTSDQHVEVHIELLKSEVSIATKEIENLMIEKKEVSSMIEKVVDKIDDIEKKIKLAIKNSERMKSLVDKLATLEVKMTKTKNEINNFKEMIDKEMLKKKKESTDELQKKLEEITKERNYLDFIRKLLSEDGVKSYIIRNLIGFWNMKVNEYLKKLNADFSIKFDETLDAVIKSRNRDELQYHSFSGGEKARIDVAILMSVLDLSKIQNSIDMNVMVVDELIDNAIDAVGREDVLKLFKQKTLAEGKSIYVISHADNLPLHLFDKEVNLIKKNGFTTFA